MTKFRLNIYPAAEPNRFSYNIYSVYPREDPDGTETWQWRYSSIHGEASVQAARRMGEDWIEFYKKEDQDKEDWAERRKTIKPEIRYYD